MKRILAYSYSFQEMFFSKDIFLVPYYLSKEMGMGLEYLYTENMGSTEIPSVYRGADIRKSKTRNEFLTLVWYIVFRVWTIDAMFLNGSSAKHMLIVWLYKVLHPKGRVVIFGDMERPQAEELNQNGFLYSHGLKGRIKGWLTNFFFNHVTYIVANTEAYQIMKGLCERKGWKGLRHFYPCLDDELFDGYGLKRIPFKEKENVMICVGRIGNYQKNTEMLLEALKKVELRDWKIYMIGPVTSSFDLRDGGDFQQVIDSFFESNPQYRGRLIFTGAIYDQKEILSYYVRAKVLLSTARHEGFANVYSQAAALGCYIISTDVGGADVGSNDWKFGTKLQQEDSDGLARVLNKLVNGKILMDESQSVPMDSMCYSKQIGRLASA